jgi:hypothetical protein
MRGEPTAAAPRPRRKPIFGPEPWEEVARRTWSHWDLWFCLVLVSDFDGDWAALARRSGGAGHRTCSPSTRSRRSATRGSSARLADAGLRAADLVAEATDDRKLLAKARRKVLDQPLDRGRDLTPPMRATPRERLWCRAMHGHWERFPVSPASAHARFADQVALARRRGRGGYGIAQALQRLLDDQDRLLTTDPAARLALWRGLLTAGIEALGEVRDRDGELADFLGGSLATYARLPWQPTGIEAEVYFADLCELCVWENHGLLYQRETASFAGVGVENHGLVERLPWSLAAELEGHRLGYQAEVAIGLVAYLQAATARLDRLVATADRLGSDQWTPIVALAETALAAGCRDLARRVFAAANRPGRHQDYLAARCLELTGEPPPRRRRPRAVE